MQADLFEGARHDPRLAPSGYFAVLKAEAKPKDGSNICRACDWRPECQKPTTDFSRQDHRCMPWARNDASSVLFKRQYNFRDATQMVTPNAGSNWPSGDSREGQCSVPPAGQCRRANTKAAIETVA